MELDSKLSELFQGSMISESLGRTGCNISSKSMSSGVDEEAEGHSGLFSVTYDLWSKADESKLKMSLSNEDECLETARKPCQVQTCIKELDIKLEAMKALGSSYSNFVDTSMTNSSMNIWGPVALDQPSVWNNLQGLKETWIPPASLPNVLKKAETDKCFKCEATHEANAQFSNSGLRSTNVDNGKAVWERSLNSPKTIQAPHTSVQLSVQSDHVLPVRPHLITARKNSHQASTHTVQANSWRAPPTRSQLIQKLVSMGFQKEDAQAALIHSNMDITTAMVKLIANKCKTPVMNQHMAEQQPPAAKPCQSILLSNSMTVTNPRTTPFPAIPKLQMNQVNPRPSVGAKSCFSPPDSVESDECYSQRSFSQTGLNNRHVSTSRPTNLSSSIVDGYNRSWSTALITGRDCSVSNSWPSTSSHVFESASIGAIPINSTIGQLAGAARLSSIGQLVRGTSSTPIGQLSRGALATSDGQLVRETPASCVQDNTIANDFMAACSRIRSMLSQRETDIPLPSSISANSVGCIAPFDVSIGDVGVQEFKSISASDPYLPWTRTSTVENLFDSVNCGSRAADSRSTDKLTETKSFPSNEVPFPLFNGLHHADVKEHPVMLHGADEENGTLEYVQKSTKNYQAASRLSIREFVPGQLWTSSNALSDEQISSTNYDPSLTSRDGFVDHDWRSQDDCERLSGSVWMPKDTCVMHQWDACELYSRGWSLGDE